MSFPLNFICFSKYGGGNNVRIWYEIKGVNELSRVGSGSSGVILFFMIQTEPDLIIFGSKNVNAYPIRLGYGSTLPDPRKIIKYL
jgi:hypothetical protein